MAGRGLIQRGDQLLRIGDLTPEQYVQDRTSVPFGGTHVGDLVPIIRLRDGQTDIIQWLMPPISQSELVSRIAISLPAFIFLIVGFVIQMLLRPHNLQWLLLPELLLSDCYLAGAGCRLLHECCGQFHWAARGHLAVERRHTRSASHLSTFTLAARPRAAAGDDLAGRRWRP